MALCKKNKIIKSWPQLGKLKEEVKQVMLLAVVTWGKLIINLWLQFRYAREWDN